MKNQMETTPETHTSWKYSHRKTKKSRFKARVQTLASLIALTVILPVAHAQSFSQIYSTIYETNAIESPFEKPINVTELSGGRIRGSHRISVQKSPYLIREDLVVERDGELTIEPGVHIQFGPMVGITVHGILHAVGTPAHRIRLTSVHEPEKRVVDARPQIRLVDGPNILTGRIQLNHQGRWRSVCSNSKNWTLSDFEVACRQLGFQGGRFHKWYDRLMPVTSRILLEEPQCSGMESSLTDCKWNQRQIGSGVCDYHPDIGVECSQRHENTMESSRFWRGVEFVNAVHENILNRENTLYVPTSSSRLEYTDILYGGSGRDYKTTSALQVVGVAPVLLGVQVSNSIYNGVNISHPTSSIVIQNCTFNNNHGYGIFVNSSYGLVHVSDSTITSNNADGIRFIHGEERPNEFVDKKQFSDFCTIATTSGQTYPIKLFAEQNEYYPQKRTCIKTFYAKYGHVLTLSFAMVETERNNSGIVRVYDGTQASDTMLGSFTIRNNSRIQSVTTTRNRMLVTFEADSFTKTIVYMKVISLTGKLYDLNVTTSTIADNNGRGVAVEHLRSQVHIHKSSISNNRHVAGVHVSGGVGDVNVTETRISFNDGDGVNITYTGGSRNISRSTISSNKGFGISVWLNDTKETEYVYFNQSSTVQYSDIFKNLDTGVHHGNFCRSSTINITGNTFSECSIGLEVMSCWQRTNESVRLEIGYNNFLSMKKLGVKIYPALSLTGRIEYNHFRNNMHGGVLIKNQLYEEFNVHRTNLTIIYNEFYNNRGVYVVNLGVSPYSDLQSIMFTKNFLRDNKIKSPFELDDGTYKLIPRSRVAAVVVISSANVIVFRNILNNLESTYEIGSHLEDQSQSINCTMNWLSSREESHIYGRVFDRKDRYNLARVVFIPHLLHNSNPMSTLVALYPQYIPQFHTPGTNIVGGEVEGLEHLKAGDYVVHRDINVRPGGKLILEPGVTLNFPPSVGLLVAGKLDARGRLPRNVKFTLKQDIVEMPTTNDTYETDTEEAQVFEVVEMEPEVPIRLLGGNTTYEGRLQVRINNEWGTVCNYGWTVKDAALVCNQLGLVLNPLDWRLERNEIPIAGTSERVILSNVQCTDEDLDITECKSERDFENSCGHDQDIGLRCYESSWAGVRIAPIAERSDLQFILIEKAGLLDYATNEFKPALQIDFNKHSLESVTIRDNYHDGLGVIYSDIYSPDAINIVKNSEISNNRGDGISFKQIGMKVQGTLIENNKAGINRDPFITAFQQRELAGWFLQSVGDSQKPAIQIPQAAPYIELDVGETRYVVTSKVNDDSISREYTIKTKEGYVLGIQLLNPIQNLSTEVISIFDSPTVTLESIRWDLNTDLNVLPTTSSGFGVVVRYVSGTRAVGGTVLVFSSIVAPLQNIRNRIVKGPVPTLTIVNTKIRWNRVGIKSNHYNKYVNELGDHHIRFSNETIKIVNSEISHNTNEAIFIHSPFWDIFESNISEVTLMINNSLITDNGRGVYHFSRDMRSSNNLFHYVLQDNSIERNMFGGFQVALPYVWKYNENFTHSIYLNNNTWRDNVNFGVTIDGHYSRVNVTKNVFTRNKCHDGLMSMRGMEKKLRIDGNKFEANTGRFMVEFKADSQSEIIGEVYAVFYQNDVRDNRYSNMQRTSFSDIFYPTSVIDFNGIQKVKIFRNLFNGNNMQHDLIAGIVTARINNVLDVRENWWGTADSKEIKKKIFDFDDWNNFAVALYHPYLIEDSFDGSVSVSWEDPSVVDLENLGGRINNDLVIYHRPQPYVIRSDITVMPDVTLTISPGVVMEFAPNVGILVLGTLRAQGVRGYEIQMRPVKQETRKVRRDAGMDGEKMNIRLCTGRNCSDGDNKELREGFLEYYNSTTLQWVPICDKRFTERNAQVICRQLGYDSINAFIDYDIRIEFHSNSLSRIWSWPEPLECKGIEDNYEDCPIRLNGQLYGHRHECHWDSKFVFIRCGERNLANGYEYWGGIRIAGSEFEQKLYKYRLHDIYTHKTIQRVESVVEFVNITGAGLLHNEKQPAIQSVLKSPQLNFINISDCASDGINLISPTNTLITLSNHINNTLGIGVNAISLTGEGIEANESSFTPLKEIKIPYRIFSLLDICDTKKEIIMEERILIYYKYDNSPVNCVKIFRSAYNVKPIGFRLLQFNLFNSTTMPGKHDNIKLYDGDIYNITSVQMAEITVSSGIEKQFFRTRGPSLSVKLFANGASSSYGFVAEVLTLPISSIGFNRDVRHNISYSTITNNLEGAISYSAAGEVSPTLTMEKNYISDNCRKLYGNFTTCKGAVRLDLQNTQQLFFRNNLVRSNQGGLIIKADSRGTATSLKGWIYNNLFANNTNQPTIVVEGGLSTSSQEVTIYRNYIAKNYAPYRNLIVLKQVVSNFTMNYVHNNLGAHILEVSGFTKVQLPIYQTTSHNGFYTNLAIERDSRGTIVAGTTGQQYVDNIFFNPDNDYEIVTVNRSLFIWNSTLEYWNTKIDATHNYWSYNDTLAISGRIKDVRDDYNLLEVDFDPFYMNNKTVLNGKCPPGWDLVGDTCLIYVGAPMMFEEAREFCRSDNASMPYIMGNYLKLYYFLRKQSEWYQYSDRVWVQHIDKIDKCTVFSYQTIEVDSCDSKNTFLCEIDPKIHIVLFSLRGDTVTIGVLSALALLLLLVAAVLGCWCSKNKHRQIQRLERRNSIRASMHSLRSAGSTHAFSELSYRRGKAMQMKKSVSWKSESTRSTDTLTTKQSDYKKMFTETEGSLDSIEKSTFNSSNEDNQSYDIYETHNQSTFVKPPTVTAPYATSNINGYRNDGYKDNSTFASRNNSNYQSRANSITEETPIIHHDKFYSLKEYTPNGMDYSPTNFEYPSNDYYSSDTLPLNRGKSDSTLDLKREIEQDRLNVNNFNPNFVSELKSKIPLTYNNNVNNGKYSELRTAPKPPQRPVYNPNYNESGLPKERYVAHDFGNTTPPDGYAEDRPKSSCVLETDMDSVVFKKPNYNRSKSETLLETSFDFVPSGGTVPITDSSRSRSQPLETAM